jgi:demethoxyubiquinone hydroxylase (CLK1/Coq7/Cat5 family)
VKIRARISPEHSPKCIFIRKSIFTPYHNGKVKKMPEFASPFSGLAADRKLTHEELIRAIRYMVAAEFEAVQLYVQLAESIDNKLAREVLHDIANEEKVHAGEFLRLLKELAPDEENYYREGAEEVEKEIAKMKK